MAVENRTAGGGCYALYMERTRVREAIPAQGGMWNDSLYYGSLSLISCSFSVFSFFSLLPCFPVSPIFPVFPFSFFLLTFSIFHIMEISCAQYFPLQSNFPIYGNLFSDFRCRFICFLNFFRF